MTRLIMGRRPGDIPVLTVRPPWCWAIEHAGKSPENRTWLTKHRGPLWLHTGARSRWDPDGAANPLIQDAWDRHVRTLPGWPGLPDSDVLLGRRTTLMAFGAVTSLAEVTGCHHSSKCQSGCSPWAARGQFHIELAVRFVLPVPVPCRGSLGLWRLPEIIADAVIRQLPDQGIPAADLPARLRADAAQFAAGAAKLDTEGFIERTLDVLGAGTTGIPQDAAQEEHDE